MNLAENLRSSAAVAPEAPACKLDDEVLSYAALDDACARVAGLLAAKGIEPGDRVGLMLPNVPLFVVVYYGILRRGATAVPMNVLLKGRETAHYLSDPGAKAVFAWAPFAEHARTGAAEAGAECIEVAPGEFEQLLAAAGPKYGCGLGVCQACTSHINGKAFNPCSVPISLIRSSDKITTIEGLPATVGKDLHPMQAAWLDKDVAQCGFCQPGQIMTAVAMVNEAKAKNRKVSDAQLEEMRNVCRCGTYPRIREAIRAGEANMPKPKRKKKKAKPKRKAAAKRAA